MAYTAPKINWVSTDSAAAIDLNRIENNISSLSRGAIPYAVATGSANTYAVTIDPAPSAYTDGLSLAFKINIACTAASTLNVNGKGARGIVDALGNSMVLGWLKANYIYTVTYDSANSRFVITA